jgi:predicted nuclease with TOPRIM domain
MNKPYYNIMKGWADDIIKNTKLDNNINIMNNIETLLSQKQARQRLVQSQMRSLRDEYMPLKEEDESLNDEIEQLEEELQKQDDVQMEVRWDELIKDLNDDGVKTIEENEAIEMEQLIDEIKNPEDYANFDLTQHQ